MKPFTGCLLTKGQIAIYDLEDAGLVEQYKWHAHWNIKAKSYYANAKPWSKHDKRYYDIQMSRLIMGLELGDLRQIDHINHNTLDNRKSNLRVVTDSQNQQNRKGVKGYSWRKQSQKWQAYIYVNHKLIDLGRFEIEQEARQAYLAARIKYGFVESPEYKYTQTDS